MIANLITKTLKLIISIVAICGLYSNNSVMATYDIMGPPHFGTIPDGMEWVVDDYYLMYTNPLTNNGTARIITPNGEFVFHNIIYNNKFFINENELTNAGSDFSNGDYFENHGKFNNYGRLHNYQISGQGLSINESTGQIINTGDISIILNESEMFNYGQIDNTDYATIRNNYEFINSSGAVINNTDNSTIANYAAFSNDGIINNDSIIKNNNWLIGFSHFANTGTIVNNGIIDSIGTPFLNTGTLSGTGTFNGNFTNDGTLSPGNSIGVHTINGTYTENSTLEIQLGGAGEGEYDYVIVNGDLVLNDLTSLLEVELLGGFVSSTLVSFDIIRYTGSLVGEFSSYDFPAESFFDVFYEIELDGVWSGYKSVRLAMISGAEIPEPETYLLFGSFLILAATIKKRKIAHKKA